MTSTPARRRPRVERLPVPPDPMATAAGSAAILAAQRTAAIPSLRQRQVEFTPVQGVAEPLVMHHQVRAGLLPFLTRQAGLHAKAEEIINVFDAIMDGDLRYDLRSGHPFLSGASGALSPFLMNMSLGARQDSALRYQCEPQVGRRALTGRSKVFRERLLRAAALGYGDYATGLVLQAWVAAVPYGAMALDNVRPMFGVRHYPDRGPDLSGYFVLEAPDPLFGHHAVQRALHALGEDELWRQIERFDKATFRARGLGILAIDLAADGRHEVKLYKRAERVGPRQLQRLLAAVDAGPAGVELVERFRAVFIPPYIKHIIGGIGFVLDRGGRPPAVKIYLDTSRMYDDWEAVQRLSQWLTAVGFAEGRRVFESARERLAPELSLRGVGNFMDMVSLDVGAGGLFKTTVYYAPEVSLQQLAWRCPDQLPLWDGALSWDRS